MFKTTLITLIVSAMALTACNTGSENATEEDDMQDETAMTEEPEEIADNTLTEAEKADGWKLLFDGESTDGWRRFNGDSVGSSWRVENGTLYLDTLKKEGWQTLDGGDIITADSYENYELMIDWKISEGGNSGLIFHVQEGDFDYVWHTGPELQILDDDRHPDGQIVKHRSGDLYDLIEAGGGAVNPVGEWNTVRLVSNNGKIEEYINGELVVSTDMTTQEFKDLVAGSKFKDMPSFGKFTKGHIALQDHGNMVWFRNIKIKPL